LKLPAPGFTDGIIQARPASETFLNALSTMFFGLREKVKLSLKHPLVASANRHPAHPPIPTKV
jgi:hypothetical protein